MYNSRLRFRSAAFLTPAFGNNRSAIKGIQYVCNHKNRWEAVPRREWAET
jgi:hypothetical protein